MSEAELNVLEITKPALADALRELEQALEATLEYLESEQSE